MQAGVEGSLLLKYAQISKAAVGVTERGGNFQFVKGPAKLEEGKSSQELPSRKRPDW